MKFHVSISFESEEIGSICHQKPLQILRRDRSERHTHRYRILLSNSGYQNNLYIIAPQIASIKRRSNYLRANLRYYTKDFFLRTSIYYKSFTCSRTFCTQHRLLKRKLKFFKRVSTAYTVTPSSD
jgi:hypothetical protein